MRAVHTPAPHTPRARARAEGHPPSVQVLSASCSLCGPSGLGFKLFHLDVCSGRSLSLSCCCLCGVRAASGSLASRRAQA